MPSEEEHETKLDVYFEDLAKLNQNDFEDYIFKSFEVLINFGLLA